MASKANTTLAVTNKAIEAYKHASKDASKKKAVDDAKHVSDLYKKAQIAADRYQSTFTTKVDPKDSTKSAAHAKKLETDKQGAAAAKTAADTAAAAVPVTAAPTATVATPVAKVATPAAKVAPPPVKGTPLAKTTKACFASPSVFTVELQDGAVYIV